ncbi:MAG: hypothetical protein ACYC9Y_15515 [Candidatus Methylomirabilia bacterium]
MRSAPALLLGVLVICSSADLVRGAENAAAAAGAADIELRKSFRSISRAGSHASRSVTRGGVRNDPGAADAAGEIAPSRIGAVAEALGERLQSSGTLHLPGVGDKGIVLRAATTPILETAAGRRLIIDRERTIDPGVVDGISRRWPGFTVVQPPAGANLREVIGSTLDAAGYDSVFRSAPLIFGRGITIRVTPDFVVLRSANDLLAGETRAISVVDPAEALPAELRALAAEQRVLIVELTPDGTPAGVDRAPDPAAAGKVTSVEAARLAPVIEKIAGVFGLSVVRGVLLPAAVGEPGVRAELGISGGGVAALVFETANLSSLEALAHRGYAAFLLPSAADLPNAIGMLLKRFGIAAIGPTIEFYRRSAPGASPRFVISVPGWLAENGGRRLLITGAALPPLVRLYLTREGIDIFEYRIL